MTTPVPINNPAPGHYAPAEVVEPYIPKGEPVAPEATTALTLNELLVYADVWSPATRAARARVGVVSAEATEAELRFPANPQLGLAIGGRRIAGATGFEFEVTLQQQLEIAGEPARRSAAARAEQDVAEAVVNEVRWTVHVEVHRLFVDLLLTRERLAQAERFVAFSGAMRDVAARQVEAGESSPLVLLVAEADLAQTREVVVEARYAEAALEARLAAVVGWPSTVLPSIVGELPSVRDVPSVEALLGQMAAHHPSLRTRELALVARLRQRELEEREVWPEPTVGVAFGREAAPGGEESAAIALLTLGVPLPVFRANQAARARAAAEVEVADRERELTAVELRGELQQAAIALDAAMARVALYESDILPQLEHHLAALQRAYELGEVDIHQLSQTRERLLMATGHTIDARITYYEAVARLEGLVGTELWPDAGETP